MKKFNVTLLLIFVFFCFSFTIFKKKKGPQPFSLKKVEKSISKVKDKLYAGKFEVDNFSYNEFLADLKAKGESKKLEIAAIDSDKWNSIYVNHGEPFVNNYGSHPAYAEYPVVNISQEGARLFCNWLTDKYNEIPKRKHKKVKFRLPTEEEWKLAARAGHEAAPFPWGGYYVRNNKGEFLANFKRVPQTWIKKFDKEAGTFSIDNKGYNTSNLGYTDYTPSPVESFFPNDFKLYHMSGNAAEMLEEPGRTKGGSWQSYGYHIQIDAEDEFEGFTEPSPMIGFRYFMEVVE